MDKTTTHRDCYLKLMKNELIGKFKMMTGDIIGTWVVAYEVHLHSIRN